MILQEPDDVREAQETLAALYQEPEYIPDEDYASWEPAPTPQVRRTIHQPTHTSSSPDNVPSDDLDTLTREQLIVKCRETQSQLNARIEKENMICEVLANDKLPGLDRAFVAAFVMEYFPEIKQCQLDGKPFQVDVWKLEKYGFYRRKIAEVWKSLEEAGVLKRVTTREVHQPDQQEGTTEKKKPDITSSTMVAVTLGFTKVNTKVTSVYRGKAEAAKTNKEAKLEATRLAAIATVACPHCGNTDTSNQTTTLVHVCNACHKPTTDAKKLQQVKTSQVRIVEEEIVSYEYAPVQYVEPTAEPQEVQQRALTLLEKFKQTKLERVSWPKGTIYDARVIPFDTALSQIEREINACQPSLYPVVSWMQEIVQRSA